EASLTLQQVQLYPNEAAAEAALLYSLQLATDPASFHWEPGEAAKDYALWVVDPSAETQAWELANLVCERGQETDHFLLEKSVPNACLQRLWLLDEEGRQLAVSPQLSSSPMEALQNEIQQVLNAEGFHVLEHLLLRPRSEGQPQTWYMAWTVEEIWEVRTLLAHDSETALQEEWKALLGLLFSDPDRVFLPIDPSEETGEACYGFQLLDRAGQPFASSQLSYDSEESRQAALQQVQIELETLISSEKGLEDLVEQTVQAFWAADDTRLVADGFLPIQVGKDDLNRPLDLAQDCTASLDPYSFWLTVVFPYWPARFRDNNMAFRHFCERTLRLEAPAHVALKICWLDVCQLQEFEHTYRRWLENLALSSTSFEPCDYTDSLNELLGFLPQMTNRYPKATLHDCEESGPDDNPLILNLTSLGTANN
ncbi:MAG: hypothetical protein AAF399_22200, partial [Bacteroidota bacterium]